MFAKGDLVHVPQDSIMYKPRSHHTNAPASIKVNPSPALGIFIETCSDNRKGKVIMPDGIWQIKLKDIYLNKPEQVC